MSDLRREEAARWFAALRRGAITAEEAESFRRWCQQPENRAAFTSIETTWHQLEPARGRVRPARRTRWSHAAIAVAASLLLGVFFYTQREWGGELAETAVGEQRSLTLADGSIVHLGVATRLHHRIDGASRQIVLDYGEAEFLVAKDPSRPFAVQAGDQRIVALGTRFDVRFRDGATSVAVREGVVAVTTALQPLATKPPVLATLHPGEAVSAVAQQVTPIRNVPVERIAEWRDRVLTYERATLREVVRDLNRYFPDRISLDGSNLGDERVTLRIEITDRDSTLDTLTRILPLTVIRRGNGVTLIRSSAGRGS